MTDNPCNRASLDEREALTHAQPDSFAADTRPRPVHGLPCDHADQPLTSADVPVWPGSRRPSVSPDPALMRVVRDLTLAYRTPAPPAAARIDAAVVRALQQRTELPGRGSIRVFPFRYQPGSRRLAHLSWRLALLLTITSFGGGLAAARVLPHTPAPDNDSSPILRTVPVGINPGPIAIDSRTGRAFVVDSGQYGGPAGSVSILDTATGKVLGSTPVEVAPAAIAVDVSSSRVFVVNSQMHSSKGPHGTVSMLDAHSGRLLHTIRVGAIPFDVAVDEEANRAFVLNTYFSTYTQDDGQIPHSTDANVSVLDATTGRVLRTVDLGPNPAPSLNPHTIAVDVLHGRVYVPGDAGLSVLDARSGALVRIFPHLGTVQALDEKTGYAFVYGGKGTIVFDVKRGKVARTIAGVYVYGGVVDRRNGRIVGTSARAAITLLDAGSGRIVRTVPLSQYHLPAAFAQPFPALLAEDEGHGRALVAFPGPVDSEYIPTGNGLLAVVDDRTGALVRTIPVGRSPRAAAVDPATGHAFIVNTDSNDVTVLR